MRARYFRVECSHGYNSIGPCLAKPTPTEVHCNDRYRVELVDDTTDLQQLQHNPSILFSFSAWWLWQLIAQKSTTFMMENRTDRSPSYATPLVGTNTTSPIFSSLHYKHLKRRVVHHFPRERNLTLICFVSGVVFFFFSSIYIGSTYLQEHLQDEKFRCSS